MVQPDLRSVQNSIHRFHLAAAREGSQRTTSAGVIVQDIDIDDDDDNDGDENDDNGEDESGGEAMTTAKTTAAAKRCRPSDKVFFAQAKIKPRGERLNAADRRRNVLGAERHFCAIEMRKKSRKLQKSKSVQN